jgi:hypothetical protein
MQRARIFEEAVREDRGVRREIRRIVKAFAEEIMEEYQGRKTYTPPEKSFGETYLTGWPAGGRSPTN